MMKQAILLALVAILSGSASAYVPSGGPSKAKAAAKPAFDFKKAVGASLTALTIASNVVAAPVSAADFSAAFSPSAFGSSTVVAEKVVREGVYGTYEVDLVQQVDNAESTFKSAKETKSKKGKYTALLAVLVVGSFVIPMAQYFWYVKDDDSSDQFFAEDVPEPEKKKGWFK
uniref:Uncharacterized protein n=1 Tax=Ditylum brightwellii TaxID=49249 RepID=A0A6U3SFP6_9STRA|mmetsp:Transcript_28945/g.38575  ORF Transcript_28945/g.38575 Transcript_28945/m.38575 type:complete len:172 (+) Transcript_28945:19-534(+)